MSAEYAEFAWFVCSLKREVEAYSWGLWLAQQSESQNLIMLDLREALLGDVVLGENRGGFDIKF